MVYFLQHLSAWYFGSIIVLHQEIVCLDDGWCGVGPESEKNELAKSTLKRLMKHAIWMNIHLAPFPTFEIRVSDGYGARWVADGSQFQGFLEPPMDDGYLKKWRH
jgi:hypothetical protein